MKDEQPEFNEHTLDEYSYHAVKDLMNDQKVEDWVIIYRKKGQDKRICVAFDCTNEFREEVIKQLTGQEVCPQCHYIGYNSKCQYCNENRYLPHEEDNFDDYEDEF